MLEFKREDDEREKVIDIGVTCGLIKHEEWPSLAEVMDTASQQFPEVSTKQLALTFFTDQHGISHLQIYKREC